MSTSAFCDELLKGRYQIIRILGTGGMGQTYVAEDTEEPANTPCVVKLFKPASNDTNFLVTARRLFNTEAETLKRLQHPQIPKFLDYFEHNQQFYLVQEYIDGHSLRAEMPLGMRWSESETIEILEDLLPILNYIHSLGVIHRDIKPDNIIRRKDGKLVLIDFGAVKQIGVSYGANTQQGQNSNLLTVGIGTPGYMPTEQSRGKPRPCSDLYALGMVCIRGLTGLVPTQLQEDEDGEVIWRSHCRVSDDLANMLTNMVRYHFKQRYQTAKQALQELENIQNSKITVGQETTEISETPTKIAPNNSIVYPIIQTGVVSLDNSQSSSREVSPKPQLLKRILNVGFLTLGLILSSGAAYLLALKGTGKTITPPISVPLTANTSTPTTSTSITKIDNIPHIPQPFIATSSAPSNLLEKKVDSELKNKIDKETEKLTEKKTDQDKIVLMPGKTPENHPDKSRDSTKYNNSKSSQPQEKAEPSFPNPLASISDFFNKGNDENKHPPKEIKQEPVTNKKTEEEKNYEPIILCVVANDSYEVRSSPTRNSQIITNIKNGTKVVVVGEKNSWFKITRPVEGWIDKDTTHSKCSFPNPPTLPSPIPTNSPVPFSIPNDTKPQSPPSPNPTDGSAVDKLPESIPSPVASPSTSPGETLPSPSSAPTPSEPAISPSPKSPETSENKTPENTIDNSSSEVIPTERPTVPTPTQNSLDTSPSPKPTEIPILVPSDNTSQTPASEMPSEMRRIPNLKHTTSENFPSVMPSVKPSVTPSITPSVAPSIIPIEPKVIFTKQPDITTPGEKTSPVGNHPIQSTISFSSPASISNSESQ